MKKIITLAVADYGDVPDTVVRNALGLDLLGETKIENTIAGTDVESIIEGAELVFPITLQQAELLTNEDGFVTVVVEVDQDQYLAAYAEGVVTDGQVDVIDLLHDRCFDFGIPFQGTAKIIGAYQDVFLIEYTSDIGETIAQLGE